MKLLIIRTAHLKYAIAACLITFASLNFHVWGQSQLPVSVGIVQVSSIGHTFSPATAAGGPVVRDYFVDQQQSSGGGGIVGSVSANFDLNNQFVLTITAPAGYEFLIHVPAPGVVQFGGKLGWSNPDGYYAYYQGSVSASFEGLTGAAPNFNNAGAEISQNHAAFGFNALNSSYLSGDIAFTSISLTGSPLSQNTGIGAVNYSPSAINGNVFYAAYYPGFGQTTDPGRFVSIIPVPEPSCVMFFLLGVLSFIASNCFPHGLTDRCRQRGMASPVPLRGSRWLVPRA
jgi:hypothetical protein